MSRTWLMTGCSTGFGKLLAAEALSKGDRVAATARDIARLGDLTPAHADQLLKLTLDVTSDTQIQQAVAAALEAFGRIDVLVNNAGYGYFSIVEDFDIGEFRRVIETNVVGLARLTQAVLPGMRTRRSGTIANLSSVAGRVAFPRAAFYNATKWAVEGFSEALHHEVASFGIRVIVIEPGAYATDFGVRSAVRSPQLSNPESPYADASRRWSEAAEKMMPEKQDPMEVVRGIIGAVDRGPLFMRVPFGRDAAALITARDAGSDADFIRDMDRRYQAR